MNKKWFLRAKWILLVIGLLDAVYLTYIKFESQKAICDSGCDLVNSSIYSEVLGVPVAIWGGLTYLMLMALEFIIVKKPEYSNTGQMVSFAITIFGFLYSAYLTYIEFFVLYAVCQYCMISAVIMTILLIMNVVTVIQQPLD